MEPYVFVIPRASNTGSALCALVISPLLALFMYTRRTLRKFIVKPLGRNLRRKQGIRGLEIANASAAEEKA
jgi:hypothetical protein